MKQKQKSIILILIVGYTSNYTLAVWQGFDSIDGPTKYMTQQDTQKTQLLYRLNMQNIVNIHRPNGFSVPNNVGSINGGVKIITESERRQIEEQQRRTQEENSRNSQNDNDSSEGNSNRNNATSNNNNNSISNSQNPNTRGGSNNASRVGNTSDQNGTGNN